MRFATVVIYRCVHVNYCVDIERIKTLNRQAESGTITGHL